VESFEGAVADLLRGTPIENNADELVRLRKLPPEEQLEVGFVLHEAMLQKKHPNGFKDGRLAGVRSVADARRFLDQSRSPPRLVRYT
jgi:hypothetical protein